MLLNGHSLMPHETPAPFWSKRLRAISNTDANSTCLPSLSLSFSLLIYMHKVWHPFEALLQALSQRAKVKGDFKSAIYLWRVSVSDRTCLQTSRKDFYVGNALIKQLKCPKLATI